MKKITYYIPNFLTSCNIFCGVLAIVYPQWGLHLILLGAIFDFFDGFAARFFKAYSPIGKDLDSLADMVTFGVAPAIMMFQCNVVFALLLPIFSAIRLAKFNNDNRQSTSFLGLPTPANGIFWAAMASLDFIKNPTLMFSFESFFDNANTYIYVANGGVFLFCFLMVSEIRMFSFKIKSLAFKNIVFHALLLLFILLIVGLFFIFKINILFSLPLIIIMYVFLSLIKHLAEPYEVYS